MLRLNPGDNQGVRYILAAWLVETARDAELAALLKTYRDCADAAWLWTGALAAYRRNGDCAEARGLVREAKAANGYVPAYLLGSRKLPRTRPAFYSMGDPSEAIWFVEEFGRGWALTDGALDWLRQNHTPGNARSARRPIH
jgi:hypothetical protein